MAKRKVSQKGLGFTGTALLVVAGALVLKNFAGKTQSLQYLSYDVSGVKLNLSNPLSPVINLTVSVTNPNEAAVPVEGIFGNVFYKNSQIATFENVDKINISGKHSSSFTIAAKASSLAVVANIISLFSGSPASKTLDINGMIKTGLFEQKFTSTIPLA